MILEPHPTKGPIDPRDTLEKARRMELFKFAQANGVTDITHDWAAKDMRTRLRQLGLTNIPIPERVFGMPEPVRMLNSSGKPAQISAPKTVAPAPPVPVTPSQPAQPYEQMTRAELAKTCKARGISMARTDKKEMLMEKLRGKDAS